MKLPTSGGQIGNTVDNDVVQTRTSAVRITETELHSLSQKKNKNSIHCGCKFGMMANL
jgi:hypothetical protein